MRRFRAFIRATEGRDEGRQAFQLSYRIFVTLSQSLYLSVSLSPLRKLRRTTWPHAPNFLKAEGEVDAGVKICGLDGVYF